MLVTPAKKPFRSLLRTHAAAAAFIGAISFVSANAYAGNEAVATKLFEDGKAARDKGDWKGACDLFERSNKEDSSFGALYNLGECNDKLGKYATAWNAYQAAFSFARRNNDKRGDEAQTKAKALEPKLSYLTIMAPKPAPGWVIKQDGADVTSSVGVELAIDSGDHVIEVSAPGYKSATLKVSIGTSPEKKKTEIPELVKDENAPPTTTGGEGATGSGVGGGDTTGAGGTTSTGSGAGGGDTGSKGMSGVMIGGFVVGGVGAAGLILGAAMGGAAIGAKGDVETLCPNQTCSTQDGKDALSTAKTEATVSTIGFIAGGVLLAGGAVMVIIGAVSGGKKAEEKKDAASLYLLPTLSPSIFGDPTGEGFNGAVLGGSF